VEDDTDLNDMLKELFNRRLEGYEVFQAYDGFEAGRMFTEYKPDIIVLDMGLPGVDGHKLIKNIKGEEGEKRPIVIAISGVPTEIAEEEKIKKEGADTFFSKPIDLDTLIDTVTGLVERGKVRGA
jgi:two-component system, OmpR family, response regulator